MPEYMNLYNRRETYNTDYVPADVCFLTAGVGLDRLKPSAIEAIAGRKTKPLFELQLEYSRNLPAAAIEEAPATVRRQRRKSVYWDR